MRMIQIGEFLEGGGEENYKPSTITSKISVLSWKPFKRSEPGPAPTTMPSSATPMAAEEEKADGSWAGMEGSEGEREPGPVAQVREGMPWVLIPPTAPPRSSRKGIR